MILTTGAYSSNPISINMNNLVTLSIERVEDDLEVYCRNKSKIYHKNGNYIVTIETIKDKFVIFPIVDDVDNKTYENWIRDLYGTILNNLQSNSKVLSIDGRFRMVRL